MKGQVDQLRLKVPRTVHVDDHRAGAQVAGYGPPGVSQSAAVPSGAPPEQLDAFQRQIAAGMTRAFDDPATEEQELDLESARLIIFSDLHKGSRDSADDFRRSERAYRAALGYYLEEGHTLITLGDVEELWKYTPDEVIKAYSQSLELEGEFHGQGRYLRFWGNHDDLWRHPDAVATRLGRFYPGLKVREALKLRVKSGDKELGLAFLVHGHQGTADSDRFGWFSKLVVRYVWRPAQRRFGFSATTPAMDWSLRQRHEEAMFDWARTHSAKPLMIAGHTHRPVFGTSRPPKPELRPVDEIESDLRAATADAGSRDRVASLRAELEWTEADERRAAPPIPIQPPCYFNTGCCCFPDGDVTGIEVAEGKIRLVRWPTDDEKPAGKVLVEDDLRDVLASIRAR
jgi:UDP-2,3-diacylglucosamine pyrophosphatase LpxH